MSFRYTVKVGTSECSLEFQFHFSLRPDMPQRDSVQHHTSTQTELPYESSYINCSHQWDKTFGISVTSNMVTYSLEDNDFIEVTRM